MYNICRGAFELLLMLLFNPLPRTISLGWLETVRCWSSVVVYFQEYWQPRIPKLYDFAKTWRGYFVSILEVVFCFTSLVINCAPALIFNVDGFYFNFITSTGQKWGVPLSRNRFRLLRHSGVIYATCEKCEPNDQKKWLVLSSRWVKTEEHFYTVGLV